MYNESRLARDAKALIKHHLRVPDGEAQRQVDALDDGDLLDLVSAYDYPPQDRQQVILRVLDRVAAAAIAATAPPEDPPAPAEAVTEIEPAAGDEPVDVELVEDDTELEPTD